MMRLRPYKTSDAEHIVKWINDEEAYYLWSAGRIKRYPINAEELDDYYDKMAETPIFWQMTAVDENDIPRGHLIMRYIGNDRKELRLGNIIVDSSVRGKGYGKKLLGLAENYAKYCLGAEKITLGVFTNNQAARACYDSFGMVPMNVEADRITMPLSKGAESWECVYLEKNLDCKK